MASSLWPALVLMTLVVGCGGSSSETPPPLEPDPELLAGKPAPGVVQAPAAGATSTEPGIIPPLREGPASKRPAAPSQPVTPTWGNTSPRSEMAPTPWGTTPAPKPARPAPTAPARPAPAPSVPVLP